MRIPIAVACLVALVPAARAEDADEAKLTRLEKLLASYAKPAEFDGTAIQPGSNLRNVHALPSQCNAPLKTYSSVFPTIAPAVQASARGVALKKSYDDQAAYCEKLKAAVTAFEKGYKEDLKATYQVRQDDRVAAAARGAFFADIPQQGINALTALATTFNPDIRVPDGASGLQDSPEDIKDKKDGLRLVKAACAKHPGMTNAPKEVLNAMYIYNRAADACAMADMGDALVQKSRVHMITHGIEMNNDDSVKAINAFVDGTEPKLLGTFQDLAFDPDGWVKTQNKTWEPAFKKIGEPMPDGLFAKVVEAGKTLRAKIDEQGTTISYEKEPYHDAAVEAIVKAAWAKEIKGVKIKAITVESQTWDLYDEKTFVGSDDKYDYYRVNKGKFKYKTGTALLQIPGRPYCQVRAWTVLKIGGGAAKVDTLRKDATFAKCP